MNKVVRFVRRYRALVTTLVCVALFVLIFQPQTYGDATTKNAGVIVNLPYCGPSGYEYRGEPGWFACEY